MLTLTLKEETMSEGKLANLEKTITKKDWVDIVSWISTRWQNLNWTDQEIKSLYENYKLFPKDVMWTTLFEYFKAAVFYSSGF